jgi:hypothetical protein
MRRIGATFRVEGFVHLAQAGILMLEHMGDRRIVADDDTIRFDLGSQMAIAEMPGKSHQMQ